MKFFTTFKWQLVLLPLLGAIGAVMAMAYPSGHDAFCRGLTSLVS